MKHLRRIQFSLLFVFLLIISFSCTKDLSEIGLDQVSTSELIKLGYSDTVEISAYTVAEDSVKTYGLSYAMIGSMNDPVFGRTDAEWYTQIQLAEEPTDFGNLPVFDSAFLILPYNDAYGDTLSNMTLRVYELTESIIDSVHTYSNHTIAYDKQQPLGELTFTPRPSDSTYYNGSMQAPAIRIPLNSRFGLRVLLADTSHLTTNDKFVDYFKGIAVVAEPKTSVGEGAMLKMTVSAGYSKLSVYYHNLTDTTSYTFGINTDCDRFGHYEHHGYSGASPMLKQQLDGDTTLGEHFLFLQAMGGMRVKLRFPHLKDWVNKEHVLINDAQLIFTDASPSSTFTPPASVMLYPVADDGTLYPYQLPDADEGTDYFDGTYNSSSGTYRFRLSHYVQQVLNGNQDNNGLYLIISGASINSSRLVLNGYKSPSSGMKLYIKYTIVN